jgi:hypothetical protein
VRDTFAKSMLNIFYNGTSGEDIFHIIPQPVLTYHLAYLVPKSSPFIQVFNTVIRDIQELGFLKKSQLDYQNYVYLQKIKNTISNPYQKDPNKVVITMEHMQHVFMFYIVCVVICTSVFVVELAWVRIEKSLKQRNTTQK